MESDERFKHLASDPRFKTLRKKSNKVQIDERFQSMFTDEKFTLNYKHDKRGRNRKSSGDDLRKYYNLDEQDETNDDDGISDSDNGISGSEKESTASSSSDESESECETDEVQHDWQPLDHDAERANIVTRRIAIQNLDWNHLEARDIYTLVNSIRPPVKITIYVSKFGKERLAKEAIEGPQELAEMPELDEEEEECRQLEDKMQAFQNKHRDRKAEEDEDVAKNEEIRERMRRYQLNQMKYYYAIAEFDSPESAQAVYEELDGVEYEASSLELDLRYVPDDMEFDPADMKAMCDKVPDLATYKAPQFINTALQQTTVRFTWDETDTKRQEKLNKAYTKQDLDDDLDAYLASETDSEDENKYRVLLESLDEEAERESVDEEEKEKPKTRKPKKSMKKGPELDKKQDFKFDPDDDRFAAVYESGLYNIDPSHPNFKRTEAFDRIAERKRDKRRKRDQ